MVAKRKEFDAEQLMTKLILGEKVVGWIPPERPNGILLEGRHVRLEPLEPKQHARDLFEFYSEDTEQTIWHYLPYGPFDSETAFESWIKKTTSGLDPSFFAIKNLKKNRYVGVASYLRINPKEGSIEVGHLNFSPALQSTIAATEAMYLMMKWAFEKGYRRYEWKCNALNTKSRRAAQRLGFSYEGVFRQAAIVKNHNRDTAWFAMIDKEWPILKKAYELWLDDHNFDGQGKQKQSLSTLTSSVVVYSDPAIGVIAS